MQPELHPTRLAVVRSRGQFHVIAATDLAPGEALLYVNGRVVERPSRYSIQVGVVAHIDPPLPDRLEDDLDRYPWRYLNHSCEPNAVLRGRVLVALRAIPRFEEVTFDYNTTELDMACPFLCACGAPSCLGTIRGYRHLTAPQRQRIEPHVAEHLRGLAAPEPGLERAGRA